MAAAGGFTAEARECDDHVKGLVAKLKAAVQENTGKTYEKFDAATCKSQVVAGTNYRVKVAVDDGFVHIAFFAPLPHTGADPELKSVEAGKTADDEL